MNFDQFLAQYQKEALIEYSNQVDSDNCIVTVRVITYNHGEYIKACLDSIITQQTSFKFQIMLIDDESSDGTREICKEYAQKHPELIRLFLNSRANNIQINGKPTGLFNSVYLNFQINTKYLAIIEADDYWTDTACLQKKVDILETNETCSFCFSNGLRYNEESQQIASNPMIRLKSSGVVKKDQLMDLNIPTASLVFRNSIEDIFHPETLTIPNGDILLRAKLAQMGDGYFIKELGPIYRRVHNSGMYSALGFDQKFEMMISTRKTIISLFERKNWEAQFVYDNLCHILLKKFRRKLRKGRLDPSVLIELNFFASRASKPFSYYIARLFF